MQKLKIILILNFLTTFYCTATAQSTKSHFTYSDALTLGIVQGIAECLPISSTGHLILTDHFLSLNDPTPVLNKAGEPIIKDQRFYRIQDAANGYAIVIQGGTILAVIFLYWKNIISMIIGIFGGDPTGLRLARNLVVAFLPAAITGLLLHQYIETYLFNNKWVILALILGSILIFLQNFFKRPSHTDFLKLNIHELTLKKCLFIGLMQCFALWPGISRSLVTIVACYWMGLSLKKSTEFSFLLGLITLTAASLYKAITEGSYIVQALSIGPTIVGCITAFITGAIAIRWLVGYLIHHRLIIFGWYKLILAAIGCVFLL